MAGLVRQGGMTYLEAAANSAASSGKSVQSHATLANTYGSWTELIASTSGVADYMLLEVYFEKAGGANLRSFRFDIGIGTNVIVDSVCIEHKGDSATLSIFPLPLHIPAGVQIQARCMCSTAAEYLEMTVHLFASGPFSVPGYSKAVTYGVSTARGVNVDPGGTANTKGAWSQLTASTSQNIDCFFVVVGNDFEASQAVASWLLDIAIGAGGSEVAIVENLLIVATTLETNKPIIFVPVSIPAGSAVSARCQCDINVDLDRDLSVCILGLVR